MNGRDKGGLTPLAWAAIGNHFDMVKWLVDVNMPDVNSKDNKGEPILIKQLEAGIINLFSIYLIMMQKKILMRPHKKRAERHLLKHYAHQKMPLFTLILKQKIFLRHKN